MSIHAKCFAVTTRDGRTLVCGKSPEHVKSEIEERREHYDPSAEERWNDAPLIGTCSVCGRPYRLKGDGTLRRHWKRDGKGKGLPFSDPCDGSGKPPAQEEDQ